MFSASRAAFRASCAARQLEHTTPSSLNRVAPAVEAVAAAGVRFSSSAVTAPLRSPMVRRALSGVAPSFLPVKSADGVALLFSGSRGARLSFFTRAAQLARAEAAANGSPADSAAQGVYARLLNDAKLHDEVLKRFESGRFGSKDDALLNEVVRALIAKGRLSEPAAASALSALRATHGVIPGAGVTASGLPAASAFMGTVEQPLNVVVQGGTATTWWDALVAVVKTGALLLACYVLYTSMTGKTGSPLEAVIGNSAEELHERPTVKFTDVQGVDEARKELEDLVQYLRNPEKYAKLGAKVPRGVLLSGPPGTGKTLLARAVAGEAGVPFYCRNASEFEEMLVGLGARRVRELFESAKKNAPAIIFIDEIDAMGGKRRVTVGSGSERQTLNQMLASMDGFSKNDGVIVIAATNAAEVLDPALTRPGRFDTKVTVDLPDRKGRRDILNLYVSKIVAAKSLDLDLLASATPGFSGADLATMVNSAALIAANRGAKEVEAIDFEEARDKIIMGPARKSKQQRAEILRMTAFHEAGHTLVALLTNNTQLLHKVTILPRGPTGGATYFLPDDDGYSTKAQILARIDVAMGGRVAEELTLGPDHVTTGAGQDMSSATDLAKRYCMMYSMSRLGLSSFTNERSPPSPDTLRIIDQEVEAILSESYNRVRDLLKMNFSKLSLLAEALLVHETLTAEQCQDVINGKLLPPPPARAGKPADPSSSLWKRIVGSAPTDDAEATSQTPTPAVQAQTKAPEAAAAAAAATASTAQAAAAPAKPTL